MDGITDVMNMNLGKFWEMVRDRERQSMESQRVGHDWVTKQQYEMVKDREAWPWGCKELDTT